jgi:hypothetical protein
MQQKSRDTPTVIISVTLEAVRRKSNLLNQHPGRFTIVSKANYVQKLNDMYPAEINFCT